MEIIDDDIRCPESNKPLGFGMPKPGFDLLLKHQDALRILAVRGESKLRTGAIEKPASQPAGLNWERADASWGHLLHRIWF